MRKHQGGATSFQSWGCNATWRTVSFRRCARHYLIITEACKQPICRSVLPCGISVSVPRRKILVCTVVYCGATVYTPGICWTDRVAVVVYFDIRGCACASLDCVCICCVAVPDFPSLCHWIVGHINIMLINKQSRLRFISSLNPLPRSCPTPCYIFRRSFGTSVIADQAKCIESTFRLQIC